MSHTTISRVLLVAFVACIASIAIPDIVNAEPGLPSYVPVVTMGEGQGAVTQLISEASPTLCPNEAGQGTFNIDATLERRPWQDNQLGHAYRVELEARGEWRNRAVQANLLVRQRRPGAWRWGRIGGLRAPADRAYVTHTTFYVKPGYDLWVLGTMAWRPALAAPELTVLNIKCRDPG